jgi:hypothetical protein
MEVVAEKATIHLENFQFQKRTRREGLTSMDKNKIS